MGTGKWRWSYGWNTADDAISTGAVNTPERSTLLNHNGEHTVSLAKVDGEVSSTLDLGDEKAEVKEKKATVGNLVIEDVETNAGNPDYLLFDPAETAEDKLRYPSIEFTIKNEGDPHKYLWTIKVNDTNKSPWIKKATVRGVAAGPGEITVHINNTAEQAAQNQYQDQLLQDGDTYSFDVFVAKVETLPTGDFVTTGEVEGDPFSEVNLPRLDYIAFKQGTKGSAYYLTIPKDAKRNRHYVQPKWRQNGPEEFETYFEAGYYLQDTLSRPASKVWFDLYSPKLKPLVQDKEMENTALDTDSKQEVFASNVPIEDDADWQAADDTHTFIGIFMALDGHAERRRDHKPAHTLAVNDRPREEATFQFEKINQDEPRSISWGPIGEAIYTGSIASTADNIKVKVYPKSRKNISHANWFVTWGPTEGQTHYQRNEI